MFLDLDLKPPAREALVDAQGFSMSYGELAAFVSSFCEGLSPRSLVFALCENCAGALAGFLGFIENRHVPLLVGASLDRALLDNLIYTYRPEYLWVPEAAEKSFGMPAVKRAYGYALLKTGLKAYPMNDELALLLTTSGSTGSPKLVRHRYQNLVAAAENVRGIFDLDENERAMASLPIQFTQGLSTATSHLLSGGQVLLTNASLTQKEFWDFLREQRATSFTGVPYSYEILFKLRFTRMTLPHLRTWNEGGGRLTDEMFAALAAHARDAGKRFIPTYGATETTSRMAYLPHPLALTKCGSIGKAVAHGRIEIQDDDENPIAEAGTPGELVYFGENVTLGYAECGEDLMKGDEWNGVYRTGDIAYRDEDGCHFIIGRKKRFLKLYGYRIGLDEAERMLKAEFGPELACVGTDKKMMIYTTYAGREGEMLRFIAAKTGIQHAGFEVRAIGAIPKSDAGKTLYNKLAEI